MITQLNNQDSFDSVIEKLKGNFKSGNCIIPEGENLLKVPKNKGIYFWFMHPDGYKILSKFIKLSAIKKRYTKKFNDVEYDLVYLGTAGTGKKGISHLYDRLKWHIAQPHKESNICHGTLSTLREGLGSLLSDDLIHPNTEQLVNLFMKNVLKVYWIPYEDKRKNQINSDEEILIKILKPLLNITNNPNAGANAINNPTRLYQLRRNLVTTNTKLRLGCNKKDKNKDVKSKKNLPPSAPLNMNLIVSSEIRNCIEFKVKQNQSITDVVNEINNLPVGRCTIEITCPTFLQNLNYINGKRRQTGRGLGQNIYSYFLAADTNHGNLARWKIIKKEMTDNKIKEIQVKVCPTIEKSLGNKENDATMLEKIPPTPPKTKGSNKNEIPNDKSSICKLYLIPCSGKDSTQLKPFDSGSMGDLCFEEELGEYRKELICLLNNERAPQQIDFTQRAPAYKFYNGHLFSAAQSCEWDENQTKSVYIISALFGIIRADDYIPMYDLVMTYKLTLKNGETITPQKFWEGKLDSIIQTLVQNGNDVYNLLSGAYLKVLKGDTALKLKDPTINRTKKDRNVMSTKRGQWLKANL